MAVFENDGWDARLRVRWLCRAAEGADLVLIGSSVDRRGRAGTGQLRI